ncbi:alanine--tRNA ligase [Candidatus Mycoplasma haematohominis]|uniref:Alanine--tRNA ligase n=1 Tax=Candidatus Mycoplasma haematohominis TaxID=1494318 RepID=A0A478FS59_9MOLU|nr:alanine--tRNA ligase [Candidatus Mycoplasma haemohominis]
MEWTAKKVRETWINFFEKKGYKDVSNRSVIPPPSDKSLLFINSGVAAIKSYFCGDISRPGDKLVSAQKVIRTGDIDSIGESFRHHTYFEMLGNFSIGNASRKEAIELAWELLTVEYQIDPSKLYVTVFEKDEDAYEVWKSIFGSEERIVKCGKDTNFWDMGVGPCGPCTEIYYDKGEEYDLNKKGLDLLRYDIENNRYLEIWNLVFSDFLNVDGVIKESPTKNLDTGAGLERLLAILQNKSNNFETTLFQPIIDFLVNETGISERKKLWASADYFRTSFLLLKEGVKFGNKGREYVLRKIFRTAYLSIQKDSSWKANFGFFLSLIKVIDETLNFYPSLDEHELKFLASEMMVEGHTLHVIQDIFQKFLIEILDKYEKEIPAQEVFNLVTRHGLSLNMVKTALSQQERVFSEEEYEKLWVEHKQKSFNKKITSAFSKQAPDLLLESLPTKFNYRAESIETKIICAYDQHFKKVEDIEKALVGSEIYVVLEETVVFPEAAGQVSDEGSIWDISRNFCVSIQETIKAPNEQILHRIVVPDFDNWKSIISSSFVLLNMPRRLKIERNHTSEHLLYSILKKKINSEITRHSGMKNDQVFNLSIQVPSKVQKENFDLFLINDELNKAIKESIVVNTYWGNLQQAKSKGIVGKFEEIYEKNYDRLRFVDIGNYGTELCIGTHVDNTSQIEEALIVSFKKEQKDIYKFEVITGQAEIELFLASSEIKDKNKFLDNLQNKEKLEKERLQKEKEAFLEDKKMLLEQLLSSEESLNKVKILEKETRSDVAMATFKDLRNYIQNQIVILFFKEGEGFRFFAASNNIDLNSLFVKLREVGCKCGGSSNFGSGMFYGENFKNLLIEFLR